MIEDVKRMKGKKNQFFTPNGVGLSMGTRNFFAMWARKKKTNFFKPQKKYQAVLFSLDGDGVNEEADKGTK